VDTPFRRNGESAHNKSIQSSTGKDAFELFLELLKVEHYRGEKKQPDRDQQAGSLTMA